jgi:exonuclease SbcD
MLLLHAADLHLGKTLHERDLIPDQEAMLDRLLELLASRRPAALLLAGDLYDRSIPPPEAVRLFDSFLSRAVGADPGLVVVAIPGNHDSAARLSFGTQIMSRAGLHIRTEAELCVEPVMVERGGERAAIWPLPFLGAGSFALPREAEGLDIPPKAGEGQAELDFGPAGDRAPPGDRNGEGLLRGQAELFAEAMRRIRPRLDARARNVLLAHCFAAGGAASESERAFVGAAEQVEAAPFDAFDYVALGHLHRFQAVGARGRYAGSPLAYSFSEGAEPKGFVLVDLKPGGGFEAELLPIEPLHRLRVLEGPFSVLSAPGAFPEHRDDFIEARLTDAEGVLNPADPLRANFPNLLSVRQAAFELSPVPGLGGSAAAPGGRRDEGPASVIEDFQAFHEEMRGSRPDEGTEALFASLVLEAAREAL